jgi:hypothetical protein
MQWRLLKPQWLLPLLLRHSQWVAALGLLALA